MDLTLRSNILLLLFFSSFLIIPVFPFGGVRIFRGRKMSLFLDSLFAWVQLTGFEFFSVCLSLSLFLCPFFRSLDVFFTSSSYLICCYEWLEPRSKWHLIYVDFNYLTPEYVWHFNLFILLVWTISCGRVFFGLWDRMAVLFKSYEMFCRLWNGLFRVFESR